MDDRSQFERKQAAPQSFYDRPRSAATGFTLFEVAISLLIVTFAVVSVLLVFPVGIQRVHVDRYKLYASAIATQLVDTYSNNDLTCSGIDYEATAPWEIPLDRRVNHPDLEIRCSTQRTGLMPLPVNIAKRIDSDGDEIAHLLDEGGYVYYMQPQVVNLMREDTVPTDPPNDLQGLLIGVAGNAQHNASFSFPGKAWPYYDAVPNFPLAMVRTNWQETVQTTYPACPQLQWYPKGIPKADYRDATGFSRTYYPGQWTFWGGGAAFCWQQVHELGDSNRLAYNVFRSAMDYYLYPPASGNITAFDPNAKDSKGNPNPSTPGPSMNSNLEYSFSYMQGVRVKGLAIEAGKTLNATSFGIMQQLGLYLHDTMALLDQSLQDAGISDITNTSTGTGILPDYNWYKPGTTNTNHWVNMKHVDEVVTDQERAARIVLAMNYLADALACFTGRYQYDATAGNPPVVTFDSSITGNVSSSSSVTMAGTGVYLRTGLSGTTPILVKSPLTPSIVKDTDVSYVPQINGNPRVPPTLDDISGSGVDLRIEFGSDGANGKPAFLSGGIDPTTLKIDPLGNLRSNNKDDPVFPVNLRPDYNATTRVPGPYFPVSTDDKAFTGTPVTFNIPPALQKIFKGNQVVTHNIIVRIQEMARRQYYHFCARYPYNWAVPRPIDHATMMDYPLLELDMFRPPYGKNPGDINYIIGSNITASATPLQQAAQWRYMAPSTITTLPQDVNGSTTTSCGVNGKIGTSISYLGNYTAAPSAPASLLGNQFSENGIPSGGTTHYTLLNAFDPSERCRQLVFWAADWRQFEDCETAPSAPVDASRYPFCAPAGYWADKSASYFGDYGGIGFDTRMRGVYVPLSYDAGSYGNRAVIMPDMQIPHFRNPELPLLFLVPTEAISTYQRPALANTPSGYTDPNVRIPAGYDMTGFTMNKDLTPPPDYGPPVISNGLISAPFAKPWVHLSSVSVINTKTGISDNLANSIGNYPEVFSGIFGADRNNNHQLDRGPLKISQRIRATTVARFNYYDLRAHCQFR